MSYTRALYYPTIDIEDEEWIKNAILFWDEIDTIVPLSISTPYQNNSSSYLYEEGILKPIFLKPGDSVLEKVERQIFKFSEKEDALSFLQRENKVDVNPYMDSRAEFYLHRDKLPLSFQGYLSDKKLIGNEGWARVSANFADYYMTLLASALAKEKHLCLLTDTFAPYKLSTSYSQNLVECSNSLKANIAEVILFKLIVDGFKISSNESLIDLLAYKRRRKDELRRFRIALAELTNQKSFDDVETVEELQEKIRALYENEFLSALNAVKDTLKDGRICFVDKLGSFMTTLFVPSLAFQDVNSISLAIGFGVSGLQWGVSEILRTRRVKRSNPYSYLLSLRNDGKILF